MDNCGYVEKILVDSGWSLRDNPPAMGHVPRLVGLADATEHLWEARQVLLEAGYGSWAGGLDEVIETIRLEIDWLSSGETDAATPC